MEIRKPTKEETKTGAIKVIATIMAFLLPPVAIIIAKGTFNQLILNIILTVIFWIPGIVHALYCVFRDED